LPNQLDVNFVGKFSNENYKIKKSWNSTPMSFCPSIVAADDLTYYSPTSIFHILAIKKTADLDQSRVYWRFAVGTKNFSNLKWSLTTFFELEQNVEKGKWKKMTISLQCSKKNLYRSDLKFFRYFFFFFWNYNSFNKTTFRCVGNGK